MAGASHRRRHDGRAKSQKHIGHLPARAETLSLILFLWMRTPSPSIQSPRTRAPPCSCKLQTFNICRFGCFHALLLPSITS